MCFWCVLSRVFISVDEVTFFCCFSGLFLVCVFWCVLSRVFISVDEVTFFFCFSGLFLVCVFGVF